jgi:hypothetical protein
MVFPTFDRQIMPVCISKKDIPQATKIIIMRTTIGEPA